MEGVEELNPSSSRPSRDELKKRLRGKINQKSSTRRAGVTRKESQNLSDKIEKLLETLKNENINVDTQLTPEIIDKVTSILSINDIKRVFSQIQSNPVVSDNFKQFMDKLIDFKPP
jgi:hypothetical protein